MKQIRRGEPEAAHQFFREYYPSIYRYLLWLTERPEQAEDLTQDTFVRAWRHLDRFEHRASLRTWLHRIARREFLRSLQSRRPQVSLEEVTEAEDVRTAELTAAADLRGVIRKLPAEQREVVVLYYLQGYDYQEVAQIIRAPVSTVKYRLTAARSHLQRELGDGDLVYLNEPSSPMRQWAWLPLDQMHALQTRLSTQAAGDRVASEQRANEEKQMERREFLRACSLAGMRSVALAAGTVGLMLSDSEKEVVDSRLTHKVTLAFKRTALSDLCENLQAETGIRLEAGRSVADEKVTIFCEKMPLREVMRQLSRPFGYTWLRSGKAGEYHYELTQDLRSQLLEEELRNQDRNAALLALDEEMQRYRPYLGLSPDEALARAYTASPAEKDRLTRFAGFAWGPVQMYFRLAPPDLAALRAGRELKFSTHPSWMGERPLPGELRQGVLESQRDWRLMPQTNALIRDLTDPRGVPLTAVPHAHAMVRLTLNPSDLGQFALGGGPGVYCESPLQYTFTAHRAYAIGRSPAVVNPNNATANARFAREPALRSPVSLRPMMGGPWSPGGPERQSTLPEPARPSEPPAPVKKVTTADVLEGLHRATGRPIVADFYTRLFEPRDVSPQDMPLFDALNQLADAMRLRWTKEGDWLQFRSASFYHDRLKEVPNRLLSRWSESRRRHGYLTLDDLVEIAQLPDPQLDAQEMAEGARELWRLAEWGQACYSGVRPHLRYLASFTAEQRGQVQSAAGLSFDQMTLPQQQQFIAFAFFLGREPLRSLEELAGATLRVDYSLPGWFQWGNPDSLDYTTWVVLLDPQGEGRRIPRPPVRERTREATLEAARRIDPRIRETLARAQHARDPRVVATADVAASEIYPTRLRLTFIYIPGAANKRGIHIWFENSDVGPRVF